MARFPIEEIDYKKLYKKLDLNKDLKIDWPVIEEPLEVVIVDENAYQKVEPLKYELDEFDEDFCGQNEIPEVFYTKIVERLDKNHLENVFKELDKISTFCDFEYSDICGKEHDEDINPMLVCQGCRISVHEDCYGVVESPKDRWLCKKCIFHFEDGCCSFCNKKGGILKKTENNEWGHVTCTLLNSTLSFCNTNIRDPIEVSEVSMTEGYCSICEEKGNFLIKCAYEGCYTFYHAGCGAEKLYCDLNNAVTYCNHHNPLLKHEKILSKRNRIRNSDSYPELTNKILLRLSKIFITPQKGEYLKVIEQEPKINLKGLKKMRKEPNFDKFFL